MTQHDEEREYPREDTDTRPVDRRPFIGRWPNPLWVGLDDCENEEGEL
jgi:hypothetical protein